MSNIMSSQDSINGDEDKFDIINHKLSNNKSDKLLTKAMDDINKVRKLHLQRER